ncbi:MAG: COX15/CtaA family protein [Nitrosomonadales bacterium]|nr:COX15/CtaA family protein [Nitrosomonadales bacterium]
MYFKLVLVTCVLAFCAVVLSAYARLADAGLGCANWPACYEENALKERQPPQAHAARSGAARGHDSWQWKLHGQLVQLLGLLAIAVCGVAWKKRRELRQSPLLPTLLLGLMIFLAAFGVWAFGHLPRPVTVSVHLASGMVMLLLLTWIALRQMAPAAVVDADAAQKLRSLWWLGIALLMAQIMQGGWVSANFAALACTDFPLCRGALLPPMDFSSSPNDAGLPLSPEKLTAIHWMHRVGALLAVACLVWLSFRVMAVKGLRNLGKVMLGLVVLEALLGIANVLLGLPLLVAVLHNAVAMLLLIALVVLGFRLQRKKGG